MHGTLSLPLNQTGYSMAEQSASTSNTISCKFMHVKLMSIDEISMVGSRMFSHINRRLQQIFRSTTFFGRLSVIVVGDLKQLAPVGDQWIFQPSKMNGLQELAGTLLWELFEHFELKKKK